MTGGFLRRPVRGRATRRRSAGSRDALPERRGEDVIAGFIRTLERLDRPRKGVADASAAPEGAR